MVVLSCTCPRARCSTLAPHLLHTCSDASHDKLHREAAAVVMDAAGLELLPATALGVVIRYIFKALGAKHVGKVTASRDAMMHNVERLGPDRILELFENPPDPPAMPAGYPELYIPEVGSPVPAYESFASRFGEFDVELPDEAAGAVVVGPQPWLEAVLEFCGDTAYRLTDKLVAYKFDEVEGGWAVGRVTEPLDDPDDTVTVIDGALSGEEPKNARVFYFDDDACFDHLLKSEDYAPSVDAPDGSWCFLGKKSGKQRKAAGRAAIDLGKLSAGELDALEKQIQQRRAAAADDADSD